MSLAVALPSLQLVASGYHAPIIYAVPLIIVVVLLRVVYSKRKGRPALVGKVVVRCNKGHIFATTWSPLGSLTSIRLGVARFQRCPVGNHWALVRPTNEADLNDEERRMLMANGG